MSSSDSSSSSSRSRSRSRQRGNDKRVYVTGYSLKQDTHDLKKLFKKYGKIQEFAWKGKYCFIEFYKEQDAKKAVKKLNKEDINGYPLVVEIAKGRKQSSNVCYNCGHSGHLAVREDLDLPPHRSLIEGRERVKKTRRSITEVLLHRHPVHHQAANSRRTFLSQQYQQQKQPRSATTREVSRLNNYNIIFNRMNKSKSPIPKDKDDTNSKVRIAVRIRPTLNTESEEDFIQLIDDNTIKITRIGNSMRMKFSDIIGKEANQNDVQKLVSESIRSFIKGTNNTIFAYGQTGAGKTYTIMGGLPENVAMVPNEKFEQVMRSNERGILPRAVQVVVGQLKSQLDEDQCRLYLSMYEIYNEKLFDLFNPRGYKDGLEIRENKNGDVQIPELSSIQINDIDTANEYLMLGLRNRVTGCSHANSKSSRSHCIFQLTLQQVIVINNEPTLQESSLKIVDLAGSEKFKIPPELTAEEKEIHIQELTAINGSLSCLGHCISALIERSRTHIPFRNSKLTRVLSDSLSGSGKILFIVCVSPSISHSAETFSTLQFANRAKRAVLDGRNLPIKKNSQKQVSQEEYQELYKLYLKEKSMREELEQLIKKRNQGDLLGQIAQLKQQNKELQDQLINSQNDKQRSDKKVRFADDYLTAHMKEQLDKDDSYENLAIFQELKQLDNKDKKKIIVFIYYIILYQNFEEKFKNYFGSSEYQTTDLAQFNTGKQFDSIIRKVNDKQNNISHIVQDLKKEMSKAVNQLEQLQKEDRNLQSDSSKENYL